MIKITQSADKDSRVACIMRATTRFVSGMFTGFLSNGIKSCCLILGLRNTDRIMKARLFLSGTFGIIVSAIGLAPLKIFDTAITFATIIRMDQSAEIGSKDSTSNKIRGSYPGQLSDEIYQSRHLYIVTLNCERRQSILQYHLIKI